MSIIFFIPVFIDEYRKQKKSNFVNAVIDTFAAGFQRIKDIETGISSKLQSVSLERREFWNFPNLHLLLLFLVYSGSLIVWI
jgi:adenosine deaminase